MSMRKRLEGLVGSGGVFSSGENLIREYYAEQNLVVEDYNAWNGEYEVYQYDSKFDGGKTPGEQAALEDIVAWGFQQLIGAMLDE